MNKILVFIFNNEEQLLLLRNNPNDPDHGGDFWYTVTGGFESNETDGKDVVRRELKEETNLNVNSILYLNWILKYNNNGTEYNEYVYFATVNKSYIILNEENIDYKWVTLEEFIAGIKWYGSKEELSNVLTNGINGKLYFENEYTSNM